MNTSIVYGTGWARLVAGMVFAGLLSAPAIALGQSLKEEIVGTWRTVSFYNEEGGVKRNLYGDKPLGLTAFDRSGYVISFLSIPELPKFAVNNRLKGTDAEYRAVMQGMISQFGTYTVEGDTVTIKWVASSFPNRAGTMEKRTYKIKGNEMTSVNPTSASGGTAHQTYVRAK
jgi:Lipocalin-like domain